MKYLKLFGISFLALLLSGCLFKRDSMEDIDIYTTIYPLNYLTTYLYGDYAKVHSIYPSGVEVSEFNLSDKKITEYSKSDLFIFNGLDKDRDYAVKMINKNEDLKIIDTSMSVSYDYSVRELWLNPNNYLMMAQNLKNGLLEYVSNPYLISNKDKTGIEDKYEELNKDLSKLDANLKEALKYANYDTIVVDDDTLKFLENLLTDKTFTVLSLDNTEEVNITYTVLEGDTLDNIAKENKVNKKDIIKLNNLTTENLKKGQTLEIVIKTVSSNTVNKVKKLINEEKIKYIYTLGDPTNDIVEEILENYEVELITINDMNTIDGGVSNSNESYLTIMNNNIDLLKKELYK